MGTMASSVNWKWSRQVNAHIQLVLMEIMEMPAWLRQVYWATGSVVLVGPPELGIMVPPPGKQCED